MKIFNDYKILFQNKSKLIKNKGFTLVELLVTITIFVIVTGVVLVNSNKFDSTVLLHNFAYDVALTIKQAQSYGVNVKESSIGTFDSTYGVYFNIEKGSSLSSNSNFLLFNDTEQMDISAVDYIDLNSSCSNEDACVQKYTMKKGTYIQNICTISTGESDCENVDKLVVFFKRPNLNANIYSAYGSNALEQKTYAKITLSTSNNSTSSVVVTSAGQIYVKQ